MKLLMKRWISMAVLAMALLAPVGLGTGCALRLEKGGAYAKAEAAPDKAFFAVDSAFDLAYAATDTVFKFERDNRRYLWGISPEIKHGLDKIRPQAKEAVTAYARARRAYLANPTPAGLSGLQTILGRMQQLSGAAQAALPK